MTSISEGAAPGVSLWGAGGRPASCRAAAPSGPGRRRPDGNARAGARGTARAGVRPRGRHWPADHHGVAASRPRDRGGPLPSGGRRMTVRTATRDRGAAITAPQRCAASAGPSRAWHRAPWRSSWWLRVIVSASRSTSRQTMPNVSANGAPVSAAVSKMRRCSGSRAASRRRSSSPRKDPLGLLVGAGRPLDVIEQRHGVLPGRPRWRPA